MIRILILGRASSPHIIKWIRQFDRDKYDVWLISNDFDSSMSDYLGEKFIHIKSGNMGKLAYIFNILKLNLAVSRIKPDVVNAHYITGYGLMTLLMPKRYGLVLSVWGSDIYSFPYKSIVHRKLVQWILRKADEIICTSQNIANEVSKTYPHRSVNVIPFSVSGFMEPKYKFISQSETIIFGTAKALEKIYDLKLAIDIVDQISAIDPKRVYKLRIAGGGSLEQSLKDYASELSSLAHIEFLGKLTPDEMRDFYLGIDFYMATSLHESFGMTIAEAGGYGIPTVAVPTVGFRDIINKDDLGLILQGREAKRSAIEIISLIKDDRQYNKIAKNIYISSLSRFSVSRVREAVIEVYKKAIK